VLVCKVCNNQNKDTDAFCLSCGKSTALFSEHVDDPPPPPPSAPVDVPEPEPEQDLIGRVRRAVGMDRPASDPATPATFSVPPTTVAEPPPKPPSSDMTTGRGDSVAPTDEPDRPSPKPYSPPIHTTVQPGDVRCPKCGAGNSPDRHFCQRCGTNLKLVAAVPVKVPWYRRLFPARSAPAAGIRPSSAPVERKWGGAAFRVIALGVVVVVVLAYAVVSPLRTRVNDSVGSLYATAHKHFFPTYTRIRPSDATASSAVSTHPARLTIDLITETYWAANTSTDKQLWVRLIFADPVDINTILITSGAGNDFATIGRPKDVKIVFSDKSSVTLTLKDDPNADSYDLGSLRHTTFVEIHILSVYPSAQSPDVAINEVEFLRIE